MYVIVCSARNTLPCHRYHFSRSNSSARSVIRFGFSREWRPLAIWLITVRRMLMWNQSNRCSAWGLRYSGSAGSRGWSLTRSEMLFDVVGKVRWSGMELVTFVAVLSAGFREVNGIVVGRPAAHPLDVGGFR